MRLNTGGSLTRKPKSTYANITKYQIRNEPDFLVDFLFMMTAYFDDSGTDSSCSVAVAAAYVSSVEQWGCFIKDWTRADADEKFGVFHMADFRFGASPFDTLEWADKHKKTRLLFRLINIIRTRARKGFSSAVVKADYEDFIGNDKRLRKMCGSHHYTFAIRNVLSMIWKWKTRWEPTVNMKYIFDPVPQGKGEIINTFEEFNNDPTNGLGFVPGGYAFESKKEVLPLQAADILAWHSYRHMVDIVVPKRNIIESDPGMQYLMKDGVCETRYFDRINLEPMRQECVASEYYRHLRV